MSTRVDVGRPAGRKIVILVGAFVRGGSERQAYLLARELRRRGLNIEVWALWDGDCAKEFEAAGVPTRALRFRRPQCPVRLVRGWHWTSRLLKVVRQFREGRIDTLLPLGSWPNVIAGLCYRLAGIRLCIWGERSSGRARGERIAIKQVRRFAANSTAGVEYLAGERGIPRQRIFLVPNGVEETVTDCGTDWRTKLGLKPEQPLVVSVAALDRTRDHATLLHAWKIVQDASPGNTKPVMALAGGFGDAYAECRQIVRKGGLDSTVRFLGMIHDVPALIHASDLAVFSSHGEGVPNGVLECMAGGKAVIASDLAGVRDALGPSAAEILVSPGDADQFARKILDLLRDKDKRQALGEANRARVRSEFRVEDMAKRYFDIIQDDARPVSAGGGDGTARAWEAEAAPDPARKTEPVA